MLKSIKIKIMVFYGFDATFSKSLDEFFFILSLIVVFTLSF